MYDFVILHGSFGSPFENWFPWIYQELTKQGYKVLVPQMPCGEEQNYHNWSKVLNSYIHLINNHTSFICHSLSPAFIINYLIENSINVNKLIFVAPFYQKLGNEEFDKVNSSFILNKDISSVKELSNSITCFISDTDPYVPNSASQNFANAIGANVIMVKNAGHFNAEAGYTKFELLLNFI